VEININNLYIAIGVLSFLTVVFAVMAAVYRNRASDLDERVRKGEDEKKELEASLQYEKTQNLINSEQIKNLSEYKNRYDTLQGELLNTAEKLKETEIKYHQLKENLLRKETENEKLFTETEFLRNKNTVLNVEFQEVKTKYENISKTAQKYEEEIGLLKGEISKLRDENAKLCVENRELKTKLEESEKAYEDKLELLKKSEEKLKESFENLANEILEKTNEKMTKTSKDSLSQILNPLQLQMKEFREKIEFLSKDEAEKISALQNELKNLKELSHKLSSDAENLTKALKGESKTQGNWGEMVLERVLELSGLEKGREYEKQLSLYGDEGRYQPDVVVHLPNSRDVIIDAKTSLNAYQEYIKTEDKTYIKAHIQALKNHIDSLAEKKYEYLKGVNSLDFIFMFVPIENALMLALENDAGLFEYAFKKRIVLVSPTTLLVSLRAIESSWRFERQAKNIDEVVKAAESLYDKVRGFSEDFEKIGKTLESAQKTYESAKNKLTTGRGNVIRQIEVLKQKAGIKPKKEISKDLIDNAVTDSSTKN